MNRFDALAPNSQVKGLHFLEASAGTGKTFAIEHLVTRLLIEEESPLLLEEILITTFTNAATRELKARIRKTLDEAKCILSKEKAAGHFAYLADILNDDDKARVALHKIQDALFSFERAQIFTLHGFCYRCLNEFAFDARISFALSNPETESYKQELFLKVKDFLRSEFSLSPRQLAILMKEYKGSIDALVEKIAFILEKESRILSTESAEELLFSINQTLQSQREINSALFVEDFQLLSSCYKKMKPELRLQEVKLLGDILEKRSCSKEEFDELIKEKESVLEAMDPSQLKQRVKIPSNLHYPALFDSLRKELLGKLVEAKDPTKLLLRLCLECKEKLGPLSEEKISFDALLKKMDEALKDPVFVAKVQGKYKAAIVDEFQDTDPVQWRIFSTLFLHNKTEALYLVGDPKQSIYAFRNANLYTYLQAKMQLGSSKAEYLDTNYRSEPKLVAALNTLFSYPKEKGWLELPSLNSEIMYRNVFASPKKQDETIADNKGNIHFFVVEENLGREKNWPTISIEEEYLFAFMAKEILFLKKANVKFSDIAILIKDRFQGERLFAFLKEANIPAKIKQSVSIVSTLAYALFLEMIDAMLHIGDQSKAKKVFAGPFFDFDHLILRKGQEDALFQEGLIFLCELKSIFETKGFSAFFHAFLQKSINQKTVLENLAQKDDFTLYLDLKSLFTLIAQEEAQSYKLSLQEIFFYLLDLPKKEKENLKTFREEEGDKVQIMTTHASKGLEFDIVFALGIAYRRTSSEEWVVVREENRIALIEEEAAVAEKELKEIDAEKQRLLYVALTRARKRVYIPYVIDLKEQSVPLGSASPIELFCEKMGASGKAVLPLFDTLSQSCSLTYGLLEKTTIDPHLNCRESQELIFSPSKPLSFKSEWVYSFSSLKEKGKEQELKQAIEITPHTLPLGAETGNILHRILERSLKGLKSVDTLVHEELRGSQLQGWEEIVINMVNGALHLPLPFKLADVPKDQMRSEMEFLLSHRGVFLKGFIDLIFFHEGKYYILDWKSNYLESYSDEALRLSIEENEYNAQAAIYALALERYVKLFDKRPWKECFGGAIYLYLRGPAAHCFMPEIGLLDKIANLGDKTWE